MGRMRKGIEQLHSSAGSRFRVAGAGVPEVQIHWGRVSQSAAFSSALWLGKTAECGWSLLQSKLQGGFDMQEVY